MIEELQVHLIILRKLTPTTDYEQKKVSMNASKSFEFFCNLSFSAKSWQNHTRIYIQWVATVECQYWQDSGIWQEMTIYRKNSNGQTTDDEWVFLTTEVHTRRKTAANRSCYIS